MSELELSNSSPALDPKGRPAARKLSDIILVRNRIFYAKPALTARGRVQVGYKHIRIVLPSRSFTVATDQTQTS